ncbi:hypothetical protein ADUPG1_009735 [Aduncisulcus paluster]|uniref:Uncharacterized protein n=1 Tax=Aduncisulcus paluster TaxID=2918883 RepID=A0ABQ5KWL6_9EUKA|nr:hypothetical protein ADUPG1_009735 [Aduncisulcus paluster]
MGLHVIKQLPTRVLPRLQKVHGKGFGLGKVPKILEEPVKLEKQSEIILSKKKIPSYKSTFKKILVNRWVSMKRPKKPPKSQWFVCCCQGECGPDCENRFIHAECHQSTCPCGPKCANSALQRRDYAKTEVKYAGKKGFGLFAKEFIPEGRLITEYIGEVIDEEELLDRVGAKKPGDHDYFLEVQKGKLYIDSQYYGNESRFINHSCEPNAERINMQVGSEIRVGIYAFTDIEKGEEISFDYEMKRMQKERLPCYCGCESFEDDALLQALCGYAGLSPSCSQITVDEINSITSNPLDLANLSISNISGLENLSTAITEILLQDNVSLVDITPISSLLSLSSLNLSNTSVNDLSSFSNLNSLTSLYLGSCPIDYSTFNFSYSLEILDISDTGAVDFAVLESFTDLSVLILDNCEITNNDLNDFFNTFPFPVLDFLSLSGLNLEYIPDFNISTSSITTLDLSNNSIEDLLPLYYITGHNFVELDLSSNLIADPTPLFLVSSQLEYLSIGNNYICGMDEDWLVENLQSISPITINDDILEQTCNCATKYSCHESFATDFVVCKKIQNEYWASCASVAYYTPPSLSQYANQPISFSEILFECNFDPSFYYLVISRPYDRETSMIGTVTYCIFGWYGDECDDPCPINSVDITAGHSHCIDDMDIGNVCHSVEHYCECGGVLTGNACNIIEFECNSMKNRILDVIGKSAPSVVYVYELYDYSGHLDLSNDGCTDISGLRYAAGVSSLDLSNAEYSSLEDISELNLIPSSPLVSLNLKGTCVHDLINSIPNLHEQIIELHLRAAGTSYDDDDELTPSYEEWSNIDQLEPFINLETLGLYQGDSHVTDLLFLQELPDTVTSLSFQSLSVSDISPLYLYRDRLQYLDIDDLYVNFNEEEYSDEIEIFRSYFSTRDTLEIIATDNSFQCCIDSYALLSDNQCVNEHGSLKCTETSYVDARTMNYDAVPDDLVCNFIDPFEQIDLHNQCFGLSQESKRCVGVTDDGTIDDVFVECQEKRYGENCDGCIYDEIGNVCPEADFCNNPTSYTNPSCRCDDSNGLDCNAKYRALIVETTGDDDLAIAVCESMGLFSCSSTEADSVNKNMTFANLIKLEKLIFPASSDSSYLSLPYKLKVLSFEEGTHLEDLSFIARMWHLRSLDLGNVQGINKSMFEGLVQAVLDRSLEMELDDNYSASETYCFGSCHLRYLNLSGQSLGLDINDSSNSFSSTLSLVNGFAICSGDCSNGEDIYPLGKLLTHVDLSSNSIYDPSIIGIQPSFRRLTHIDLSENNISDISLVGALIQSLDYIHNLDLSGNMLPCASDNECNTLLQETMPSIDISGVTLTFEPQYELVCGSESCGGENMTCIVQAGSPTCACLTGYYLLGESCIEDVDGYCSSSCTGERGICKVIQDDTDSSDSLDPVCVCSDEWYGDDCDFACPIDNDGYLCGNDHGSCDIMSHSCSCDGYTGSSCEIECDADVQCSSNGLCSYFSDVENGEQFEVLICECESGYYGSMCQSSVPVEIFIENGSVTDYICGRDYSSPSSQGDYSSLVNEISHSCDCSDNGFAVSAEGFCIDPSTHPDYKDIDGNDTACWIGYLCGNDHGSCDIMSHSCSCDGYTGSSCEIECDADVQCSSNGLCSYFSDVENGEQFEVLICECESGYYGSMCQSSVPVEIFIENGSVTDYICGRDYSSPSSQGDYSSLVNEISHSCDCSDNGFAVSAEGFCIDPSTHPDYKDIDGNDTACVRCGISELSHGSCVIHSSGSAFCSCDYGYGEEAIDDDSESFASDTVLCSTFICGVSSSLDLGACNGHGSCLLNSRMSYECQCDGVWSGISCSLTSNETSLLQWFLIVSIFVLCALIISLIVFAVIRRENKKYYLKTTILDSENLVQKTDTEKERSPKIGEMILNPSRLPDYLEHFEEDQMETVVAAPPPQSSSEEDRMEQPIRSIPEIEEEGGMHKIIKRKRKKIKKRDVKLPIVEMSEMRAKNSEVESVPGPKKTVKKRRMKKKK